MGAVQHVSYDASERATAPVDRARLFRIMQALTLMAMIFGVYMALVHAGTDARQGQVQRIFYMHLASYAGAAVAFGTAAVAGVNYLRARQTRWDVLSLAGVEVGFTLSIITVVTGMVWARPIWNTWWTWDPRLTSAAIMVLTYAAYLMLRNGIHNPDQRRRFAAVYAILALSTVIFTFMITRIRPDTIHPTVIGPSAQNAQGSFAMTDSMLAAMISNMIVWSVFLAPTLIWLRIRLERTYERLERMRQQAQS